MLKGKSKRPSRGLRKFIRKEKARIRRELGKSVEAKEKIKELYTKILNS